jgi:hypothetical protein
MYKKEDNMFSSLWLCEFKRRREKDIENKKKEIEKFGRGEI